MNKQYGFFAIGIMLFFSVLTANAQDYEIYDAIKLAGLVPQPSTQVPPEGAVPFEFSHLPIQGGGDCLIPVDETHLPVVFGGLDVGNGCDDCSSSAIELEFTYDICGDAYTEFFVNSNGNITFDIPYNVYTPVGIPNNNTAVMIAPFWGDVDLRDCEDGTEQGVVTYKSEPNRMIITWTEVGYFNFHCDLRNTFQLILSDGTDPEIGLGNNTAFYYGDMNWTTGDASEGVGGFGGSPATVGINANDGITYSIIGRFDHPGDDYDGPEDEIDGVDYLDFQCFAFAAGDCAISFCDLNNLNVQADNCDGETFDLELTFDNSSPNPGGYFVTVGDYVSDILPYDSLSNSLMIPNVEGDGQSFTVTVYDVDEEEDCFLSFEYEAPSAAFVFTDQCVGADPLALEPDTEGGSWSGDGVDEDGLFTAGEEGAYEITYTLSGVGCPNSFTATINVLEEADASFTSPGFCAGGDAGPLVPATEGGFWFADNVDLLGIFDPSELEPGEYEVTYSLEEAACPASVTQTVVVVPEVSISLESGPVCVDEPGSEFFSIVVFVDGGNDIELSGEFDDVTVEAGSSVEIVLYGGDGSAIYEITATDVVGGCTAILEQEAIPCPICSPDAGVMTPGSEFACEGGSVSASGSPVDTEGLVWEYVLHDGPGAELGDVLAANATGEFVFADLDEGKYNEDYYISTVVGPDSGDGTPEYEAACVDVAPGSKVVFLAPVTLELNGSCDWQITGDFTLTVGVMGGLPEYDPNYTYNVTGFFADSDFQYGQTFTIILPATNGTSLSFFATDNGLSCEGQENLEVVCFKTPIELLSFDGTATAAGNLLEWSSASEYNNAFYGLEYSANGSNFVEVARIEGASNTNSVSEYSYLHDAGEGLHYYRLSQVDENGQISYPSNVIQIEAKGKVSNAFDLSPNPSSGNLTITAIDQGMQIQQVRVFDTSSQLVMQQEIGELSSNVYLNLSSLPAGVYFVEVNSASASMVSKFVKQ